MKEHVATEQPLLFGLSPRRVYRMLEIIPGFAVWLTLITALVICWVAPVWAIVFVILFDVFWLIRVLYVMSYVIGAYRQFRRASRISWRQKLETIAGWQEIYHVIVLPTYKEPYEVLEATIMSLTKVTFPLDRMMLVLATEGRDADHVRAYTARLRTKFAGTFGAFIATEHPAGLPGEMAGKGANIAWAARAIKDLIDRRGIPYQNILVSTFDADTIAHPQYFSYLTTVFLQHPDRLHTSYQPIPVFHNNVWDALAVTRVVANSTTFWLLSEALRPDRLFTFSSHSMPWQALIDVGFWQNDVVSEDSRIFLQCFLHYDGRYTVTPMYIPVSMDTVQGANWRQSLKNQYLQIRRWAYGVENFPFMVWNFWYNPHIRLRVKLKYLWNQFEGTYSWATAPVLILLLGWLPFHVRSSVISTSALAHNAPTTIQGLMIGAMVGLLATAVMSVRLLPARPKHVPAWQWVMMILQWLLLPVTMIVFGSIPAIEAQTRLMMGKYLGFFVTEKSRKSPS